MFSQLVGGFWMNEMNMDFVVVKQKQVQQYQTKMLEFQRRFGLFTALNVVSGITLVAVLLLAVFMANPLWLLVIPPAIGNLVIITSLRRTSLKSKILLKQLAQLISETIADPATSLEFKKQRVLQIETNFLNNDDELFTKKFIWNAFLKYKQDKGTLYGDFGLETGRAAGFGAFGGFTNPFTGRMFIDPIWINDGKGGGKWTLVHPMLYVLKATGLEHLGNRGWNGDLGINITPIVENLPPVWMLESPLSLDTDDSDFVFLNWRIKRRIRDLFFAGHRRTYEVLQDISDVASTSSVTFERMLRHKKVSKKLKEFKRLANLVYLTPAAKMNLVAFVDEVLQDRPYVRQSETMIDLMAANNAQINRYTEAFWQVHRRSLKFYVAEVLWMLLAIPLVFVFFAAWVQTGFLFASALFVIGGAVIAFGQMAMITRQTRDMKAKKLTPNLISSLIAIRHNMCAESVADDAKIYEYEQAFKASEKRFMLTVTEVEAVKLAKENVSDKVVSRLSGPMQNLRQNKEAQAVIYYDTFNHYRRICLRYGALELFVMLMAIPLFAAVFAGMMFTGLVFIHLPLILVGLGVAVAVEAILLRNHIRVARRKELYLLIYQKMAVLLSNYQLFTDPVNIAIELHKLENSVVRAAEIDNLTDIAEHVSAIAIVDLGANSEQLAQAHQNYAIKKEIGTNSFDESQFQGNLANLEKDFQKLGATTSK